MKSQQTLTAPVIASWMETGSKPHIHSLLQAVKTHVTPWRLFSSALIASTATILMFAALTLPVHKTASIPRPTTPQVAAPIAACDDQDQQQEDTTLFASCPSFFMNFATQPSGALSSDNFNVYTGAPEANQEAQFYTDQIQNLQVAHGSLNLIALKSAQQGYRYTSARIDTKGKQDFLYGKLRIRAMLPTGIGTWPAIWMLPTDHKYESMSPDTDFSRYLNDGEIDIAETAGVEPHVMYGIAHSRAYPMNGPNRNYYGTTTVPDSDTAYHDYEVTWTPTNLTFSIDGKAFFSINKKAGADYQSWPYDQRFYLVLNLAMGGTWAGNDRKDFPVDGVDPKALPSTMKVASDSLLPIYW